MKSTQDHLTDPDHARYQKGPIVTLGLPILCQVILGEFPLESQIFLF